MGTPLGRLPSLVPEVGFILVMDVLTGASSFYFMTENNRQGGVPFQKHTLEKKRGDGSLSDGAWGRGAGYVQIRTLAVCAEACLGSRPQGPKRLPHLRSANQLFFETFKLRGCLGT